MLLHTKLKTPCMHTHVCLIQLSRVGLHSCSPQLLLLELLCEHKTMSMYLRWWFLLDSCLEQNLCSICGSIQCFEEHLNYFSQQGLLCSTKSVQSSPFLHILTCWFFPSICFALVSARCYLCVLGRTVSCKSKWLSIGLD